MLAVSVEKRGCLLMASSGKKMDLETLMMAKMSTDLLTRKRVQTRRRGLA